MAIVKAQVCQQPVCYALCLVRSLPQYMLQEQAIQLAHHAPPACVGSDLP